MKAASEGISRGITAGLLAATTMAAWFFAVDVIAGRPFFTPAFLASILAGSDPVAAGTGVIVVYTLIHYLAFVVVGIGSVRLLRALQAAPGLLLGVVLGFLLFNLVFYGSVIITGQHVVQELGWAPVLSGNVLAGIVLMGYLQMTGVIRSVSWLELLQRHRIVREGIVAGLLGATTVAAWFLVFDTVASQVFFTPAALGSAVLRGASSLSEVEISVATVGGYTILHMIGFLIVGFLAAAVVTEAEHTPPLLLGAVLLFVTFGALFVGLLAVIAEWILEALAWWTILVGNMFAALAMGAYLWRMHPVLRQQVTYAREHPEGLEEPA